MCSERSITERRAIAQIHQGPPNERELRASALLPWSGQRLGSSISSTVPRLSSPVEAAVKRRGKTPPFVAGPPSGVLIVWSFPRGYTRGNQASPFPLSSHPHRQGGLWGTENVRSVHCGCQAIVQKHQGPQGLHVLRALALLPLKAAPPRQQYLPVMVGVLR